MSNKSLFLVIVERLQELPYFAQYKFRKRDSSFIKKTDYGWEMIYFEHIGNSWDLARGKMALEVTPKYFVRFDILHKWFEKFSFKRLADERGSWTIGYGRKVLTQGAEFYFTYDGVGFEEDLAEMVTYLQHDAESTFSKYKTLEDVYQSEITPILDGTKQLPRGSGADWFVTKLKLGRLLHPENYEHLKEMLLAHANYLIANGEPNMSSYASVLEDIVADVEKE